MRERRVGTESTVADRPTVELLERKTSAVVRRAHWARNYHRGSPRAFGLRSGGDDGVGIGESVAADPNEGLAPTFSLYNT
jgi:hypothetical protein